jgi:RNA polymerase sigma-70 factor, ECF subfamily
MNNEQIIRRAYELAEKMDVEGWVGCFTPDGTFTDMSIGVTYRGPDGPTGVGKTVEVYAKAFPDMHRELYRFFSVGDVVVVELALQGTPHIGSFRGEASFATWVYRVTANEAFMLMRSQRRRRARFVEGMDLEELESLPAANEASALTRADLAVSDHARDEIVKSAVDGLPNDDRDVVVLYYHRDLALQEIADRLSLTESAVRSRLHPARARLRGVLAGSPVVVESCGNAARYQGLSACAGAAAA